LVVPDLSGIGGSSKPEAGYDKKTQAKDIRAVVTALAFDKSSVVAHDIGRYAYSAMYPDKVVRLVVMDAPIPGIEPWDTILLNPALWHFNFRGPDAERLVAGRERIISIESGMILRVSRQSPTRPQEISSLQPMHNPEACGLALRNSRHFPPMPQKTKFLRK